MESFCWLVSCGSVWSARATSSVLPAELDRCSRSQMPPKRKSPEPTPEEVEVTRTVDPLNKAYCHFEYWDPNVQDVMDGSIRPADNNKKFEAASQIQDALFVPPGAGRPKNMMKAQKTSHKLIWDGTARFARDIAPGFTEVATNPLDPNDNRVAGKRAKSRMVLILTVFAFKGLTTRPILL